jgi:hypothetical protein
VPEGAATRSLAHKVFGSFNSASQDRTLRVVTPDLNGSDPRFAEVDEYFAGADGHEDEVQYRSDLYRLLGLLGAS